MHYNTCVRDTVGAVQVKTPHHHHHHHLTDIKLEALLGEGVAGAPGPVILLQDQHLLAHPGEHHRQPQPTDPTAHDDGIEVLWYFTSHKTCNEKDKQTANKQTNKQT